MSVLDFVMTFHRQRPLDHPWRPAHSWQVYSSQQQCLSSSHLTVYHPKVQRLAGVFAATSRTVPHGYSSAQPSISPVISREKQSCMHRKYMWNHKLTLYFILLWTRYIYIYVRVRTTVFKQCEGGARAPLGRSKKIRKAKGPPLGLAHARIHLSVSSHIFHSIQLISSLVYIWPAVHPDPHWSFRCTRQLQPLLPHCPPPPPPPPPAPIPKSWLRPCII